MVSTRHLGGTRPALVGILAACLMLVVGPSHVIGSCSPLAMVPVPDGAVVFIGDVLGHQGERTKLAVRAWYTGAEPADIVVVVGGQLEPGERESSADWLPSLGERYAVIAERTPDGALVTDLCMQGLVGPPLRAVLQERYGEPLVPPFAAVATPTATTAPSADIADHTDTAKPTERLEPAPSVSIPSSPPIPDTAAANPATRPVSDIVVIALLIAVAGAIAVFLLRPRRPPALR
ncbi:hypothetical protein BH20CHL6_BH20CHL6_01450 [soil metagenome]